MVDQGELVEKDLYYIFVNTYRAVNEKSAQSDDTQQSWTGGSNNLKAKIKKNHIYFVNQNTR
jgi:hypothetical protein